MAEILTTDGRYVEVRVSDLRGQKVRLRKDCSNGFMVIPRGTIVTVTSTWRSGVNITGEKCKHCGISARMSRIERRDIELVPDGRLVDLVVGKRG